MSIGVLHGQTGGIKLPFRVIGGTTQPSNPKDGDIWVKTSVPIMRTEFANGTWASGGVGLVFLAGTLGGSNPTGTNTTVLAINKNTGADKYILKITLTGCKQVQGSKGNWVSLDAYRYYGGTWVQFSTAFTATINVTYPAGSTCTATDGKTTLTAPDTNGTWACVVPNAGTWTVRGPDTWWTDTVVISTSGQVSEINISKFYQYNNGVFCDQFGHSEMKVPSSSGISYLSDRVRMKTKVDYANEIYVVIDKVPLDRFSKLTLKGTVSCDKGSGTVIGTIFVSKVANCSYKNAVAISTYNKTYVAEGTVYTITIDVSDLSGEYYIYAGTNTQGGSWATDRIMDVNEIYGEC